LLVLLVCLLSLVCDRTQALAQEPARPIFDSSGVGCDFNGAGAPRSFSWQHTIGAGRNRLLVVSVSTALDVAPLGGLPPPRVMSVTYDGIALVRVDNLTATSPFPDTRAAVEMFRLTEPLPPSGTYTVEVTLLGGVDYAVGGSASFSDVNQFRPLGLFQTSGGNSRAPSINALGAPNEVLLNGVATRFDGGVLQAQSPQVERWNGKVCLDQIHSIGAGATRQGAFFLTTLNWAMVGGNGQPQPWAIGAASVRPVPTKPSDFDGDGRTDISVWRPSSGNWYINNSSIAPRIQFDWGRESLNDTAVPDDYDGDRKTDIAVWRASEGNWYIIRSATNTVINPNWGQQGDVPVPADYDGDGRADLAVFRPTEGNWYILHSFDGSARVQGWGNPTDRLVPGDYDGDGRADIAVFRPLDGNWYVIRSSNGTATIQNWGLINDAPVPGDYDGDQITDFAVFRPTEGNWYVRRSTGGSTIRNWGIASDRPVPGDYDDDGRTDVAVFRPTEGNWYIIRSSNNSAIIQYLGQSGDTPVPAAYLH
jgi:FG-GAP-like repeat